MTYSRASWTALGLIAAAVVVTLFFTWQIRSRAEQVADALAEIPLVTVADIAAVPAGVPARVEGQAQLVEPALIAPLSGQACAYYEMELSGLKTGARLRRKAQGREFLLADASGTALVRLAASATTAPGSTVMLVAIDDAHCREGRLVEIAADRRDLALGLLGVTPPAESELAEIGYRECVLPAGARVAVAAAATAPHTPPSGPGQRTLAPRHAQRTPPGRAARVTLAATPQQPLYIAVSAAR